MTGTSHKRIVMAITGASGAPYGRALLRALLQCELQVHLIISTSALVVMKEEMNIEFAGGRFDAAHYLGHAFNPEQLVIHNEFDLAAGPSSGSFRHAGMIICPCSMKTLAGVAHGTGGSLVTRAADVCLKERRRLVLVPRESPLNLIHLRNMVAITEAGGTILPAMPGFYSRPETIDDMIEHLVMKMLDVLGLEHESRHRWKD